MVKQQLIEAVEWPIKNPEAYKRMGIDAPRGILLYGPPGVGKTLLARAVATESEANFISIKGPELLSKWVGESEKAVREIFRKAKLASPCIVFFDELDSIAPRRGSIGTDSGVTERVISQLLTELDGLSSSKEIILIAATNRPDILDPALIRPGRIDRLCYVPPPTVTERLEIYKIFTTKMPLGPDVNLEKLSTQSDFFTGADIESHCRESAIRALRENIRAKKINLSHFELAMKDIHPSASKEVCEFYEKFEDSLKQKRLDKDIGPRGGNLYT
jgi:transitional endoplasmic reticulum ATPase